MATQKDLDALDRAIASGVLSVESDGRRTVYRSLAELLQARAIVVGSLSGDLPGRTVGAYCSGLQGSILLPGRRCR